MNEEHKKVASIEKISRIFPADNADRIELAEMEGLGWQCVVKKGEFKVGDNIVFICIDSLVPRKPWSEFLFKDSNKQEKRIDKGRFRGNLSSGLILPVAAFSDELKGVEIKPGLDIGNLIGVKKYVRVEKEDDDESKPLTSFQKFLKHHKRIRSWLYRYLPFWFKPRGRTIGDFPTHLFPKTDEDNLESKTYMLDELKRICKENGCGVYASLKNDGCVSHDTYIRTNKGDVQISELISNPDDYMIITYNTEKNREEISKITASRVLPNNEDWYLVELEDGRKIITTGNHPFYIPRISAYRECKDLNEGDSIFSV